MITYTHDQLKTAIEDWVEDHGDDMEADFDTALGNGELRLLKDLDLTIFDITDDITLGAQLVNKLTGCIATRDLWIPGENDWLRPRINPDYIRVRWGSTTGVPRDYADYSETQYLLGPTPGQAYAGKVLFTKRPDGLAVDTSGTFLSEKAPDALFAAVLKEVAVYLQRDDIQVLETEYQTKLRSSQYELRSMVRRDYSPFASQPTTSGKAER